MRTWIRIFQDVDRTIKYKRRPLLTRLLVWVRNGRVSRAKKNTYRNFDTYEDCIEYLKEYVPAENETISIVFPESDHEGDEE